MGDHNGWTRGPCLLRVEAVHHVPRACLGSSDGRARAWLGADRVRRGVSDRGGVVRRKRDEPVPDVRPVCRVEREAVRQRVWGAQGGGGGKRGKGAGLGRWATRAFTSRPCGTHTTGRRSL